MTHLIKRMLPLVLFLSAITWIQAQSFTINGTITDKQTGETLIGATVMDTRSGKGTVTNAYGNYSLTLKSDSVHLRISYVGYQTQYFNYHLVSNIRQDAALGSSVNLDEVVITAERANSPQSVQMSAIEVPVEQIKAVPVLFGEADVLKALQLLPGVQSGSEGMSGMYVRGGGPDENLFLLDGVPLYNVNHLGGFFSAFNSDAIKNVTLYKGSFPAHFGGRISSVLDITSNNGNDKEYHGNASIGLISAKVNVEGPIVKEKTTFNISARRTYGDALIQPTLALAGAVDGLATNAGYFFYDFNAKVTHKFNERSRLFASYYMGDDGIYFKLKTKDNLFYENDYKEYIRLKYNWGNIVSSLRWNYEINPKLYMNITGSYTRYRNHISLGAEEEYFSETSYEHTEAEMYYKSGIQDYTARADFDFTPNPDHAIKFGGAFTHHIFTPEVLGEKEDYHSNEYENISIDTTLGQSLVHANELCAFAEDDWSITEALKLNAGVMLSGFAVEGTFYPSVQPRISSRYMLSDEVSVKVGYSYMTQYMHLLSNSSISLPTDLWVPVTAKIAPMNAHQVAAGLFYSWKSVIDFSLEGYYKKMDNLMEYKNGASFWGSSAGWEEKVCLGEGWAYGVEFLAQKSVGDFTGWVGYTWSKTMRLFDREGQELNNGKPFPAKYDRRHDISIVLMYKPNKNFDCSLSWVFCSGNTATIAMQEYDGTTPGEVTGDEYYWYDEYTYGSTLGYVESRNNFRMPAYHRMDVSVNFHKQKKHGIRTWNISVYNLYNRQNPYMAFESSNYHYTYNGQYYGSALVQLSIFPIIPAVSYIFKF